MSEADAAFGELVAALERDGLLANTIVLVTADHGEGFQEHGVLFHAAGLNDEVLHVPLKGAHGVSVVESIRRVSSEVD